MLFLKHGFDKPLKEACVKEFYVLPFARREEEGTEAERRFLTSPLFTFRHHRRYGSGWMRKTGLRSWNLKTGMQRTVSVSGKESPDAIFRETA